MNEVARGYRADTALRAVPGGAYEATVHEHWLVARGAHGGFIAGVVTRAVQEVVPPERPLRSLTVHFVRPPAPGSLRILPRPERIGRSGAFVSVRVTQDDELIALALAAASTGFSDLPYDVAEPPPVPPPEDVPRLPPGAGPAFLDNFEIRWCVGDPPFSRSPRAEIGGWLRTDPPEVADAAAITTFMDAFPPALFPILGDEGLIAPTLDLTVHLRAPLPLPGAAAGDHYLAVFSSTLSRDGFFEEDGRLWARDGTLVAQSRQLALLLDTRAGSPHRSGAQVTRRARDRRGRRDRAERPGP